MVAAIGEREIGLGLGADGADDMGAHRPRPLAGQEADAAGCGVDQHAVMRLDLEGLVQEVPDRQPLEHQDGALLVGDVVGQFDELVGGDHPFGGVAAEIEVVGDAIAEVEIRDAGPDGNHFAGGLVAGNERQAWRLVEPGAEIDVDEIEADGVLADAHLARSGRRHGDVLINQGFRTPYLVHAHGLGHDDGSPDIC